jgi:hypothetical protein
LVHQCTRLKASQQHIPNQSKHSFQSSRFRFCTPALCRRDCCWLRPADRQAARPRRPRRPRWPPPQRDRAGRAGLRRSATVPAAPASAAARPRRPRWPPLQRSTLLPNRRSVGMTSPTVLTIHRAAMDLSWSRMWHDVLW